MSEGRNEIDFALDGWPTGEELYSAVEKWTQREDGETKCPFDLDESGAGPCGFVEDTGPCYAVLYLPEKARSCPCHYYGHENVLREAERFLEKYRNRPQDCGEVYNARR